MDEERLQLARLEAEAREAEENTLRELGRSLAGILDERRWPELSPSERETVVEQAHAVAASAMEIKRTTAISWTDDAFDEGAGYEETTGVIHIPRHHLDSVSAETFAGLLGHELRHAWQWDVIEGRTASPSGDEQRKVFKAAYDAYDANSRFKYANNELELDANDRAFYVVEGFRLGTTV